MSDIKIILDQVLSDENLVNGISFKDRVYTDEPITYMTSKLKQRSTPQKIKEMKELMYSPEAYWKTSAWLFYSQGKLMEDYEDDFIYSEDFTKYYPCYRDFSVEQLRGYFTWRKDVRNKIINKAPLPFVFIYIYELINCIGADAPEDCFILLKDFIEEYSKLDDSIKKYSDIWLIDFIVYYELPQKLIQDISDIKHDNDFLVLMHWSKHTDEDIFEAISNLSSYQFKQSLYYLSSPDEFRTVLVRSFVKISVLFSEKHKHSLFTKLFGNIVECKYNMFQSAIFYDRHSLRSCEYAINEIHIYTCKCGKWSCKKVYGNRNRNNKLGELVKAVDSLLREKNNFRHKISCVDVSKTTLKLIQSVIDEYYEELRRIEAKKINIDISKLNGIRKAADITREKLLVEEETPISEIIIDNKDDPEINMISDTSILDKDEKDFLFALLFDEDIMDVARKCRKTPSILADSINQKMFNHFSDNIIDFSGDVPYFINDYIDEIKGIFINSKNSGEINIQFLQ